MKQRESRVLQQLKIIKWHLHAPAALRGEMPLQLPNYLRLVVVAELKPDLAAPFFNDLLSSCNLAKEQVCYVAPWQVSWVKSRAIFWFIGEAQCPHSLPTIISPALEQLQVDADAKRKLWQTIGQYVHRFSSPTS